MMFRILLLKKLLAELSTICSDNCIIASNTSSISLTSLASVINNPERFIGMHFFSLVPAMKLLEITRGLRTSDDTLGSVKIVAETMKKKTIVSKDSAGFIVNRMLDPMLNEAIQMLDEGVGSVEDINDSMMFYDIWMQSSYGSIRFSRYGWN